MPASLTAGTTIAVARRAVAEALRTEHFDTPDLDARILVAHALGLDHAALIRDATRQLSDSEIEAIGVVVARRLAHEPVARIVGSKEFWSLPLAVDATTLVPRPETETLVEAALDFIGRGRREAALHLLDIGTGSGALMLALLSELPNAWGIAIDISIAALRIAADNAKRLGLADRVGFVACDMTAALRGTFDVIVCNPPYVSHDTIATLAPGVRDYDPHLALDGGADGLDPYRALAQQTPALLAADGACIVELGAGQASGVSAIFQSCGLAVAALRPDLNGIPRALTAVYLSTDGLERGKKPLGLSDNTD